MVKAYDGEVSALPDDKYNMWALVGIVNVTETFNDMSPVTHVASVANALNKQKQQSWFTAMQLAAVHDFNYWSLYDTTTGLFSFNSTLPTDAEYLKVIKDNTEFTTEFVTRAEFEGMVHTKAKMWMVGSGHIAHVQELPYISWLWLGTVVDDPYKKFMMDVSGQNSANDLWTLLGYSDDAATKTAVQDRLERTINTLTYQRRLFYFMELKYLGHLINIMLAVAIMSLLCFTCCCCCCCCTCCQILPCCYKTKVIKAKTDLPVAE